MAGMLGVIVLAMYGDRTPFYQDPYTYHQSYTKLTPLGQAQEVQLGAFLREHYLNPNSPNFVPGVKSDVIDDRQLLIRADNGGEGGAIVDSAVALLQGLFPPTPKSRTSLANGTTVVGPFGGYQYVAIETVEPQQSIQLEGWSQCPTFEKHTKDLYASAEFKKMTEEAQPFLQAVQPYLYGIPNTLENMWNIYDYINYNYIHNETYAYRLPPSFLQQAQYWADYHEHAVFTDTQVDGIGNVAGRTILPSLISSLERIANPKDALSFVVQEISYKPFISFFNLTGIDVRYPELNGLPSYASAIAFEVRNNEEGETFLRTKFKNGTFDDQFHTINLFNRKDDIALNELIYRLDLAAIHDTAQWCKECNQHTERGCNLCKVPAYVPTIPTFEDRQIADGESCAAKLLNNRGLQFTAIFATVALALFSIIKLVRSRKSPKLTGYDPLPTSVHQYYDAPAKGRDRF